MVQSMRITLREVAAATGVSIAAVSIILNGKGQSFAKDTRERVTATARRLGYRRNALAKAIAAGRCDAIGLLMDRDPARSAPNADLILGLSTAAAARGLHLAVATWDDETVVSQGVPTLLREVMVDGLLINYHVDLPPALETALAAPGLPAVWLNRDRPTDAVLPDEAATGQLAVSGLVARGHRRLGYVDPFLRQGAQWQHFSRRERWAGAQAAAASLGVELVQVGASLPPLTGAISAWHDAALRDTAGLSAFIANAAPFGLIAALARAGRRVPQNAAVVGLGDMVWSSDTFVPMVGAAWRAVAEAAVAMLARRVAAPDTAQAPLRIAPRWWFPEGLDGADRADQ